MSTSSPTRPRWLVVLLVLLPLWLLLSAGAAVWNFLQREREDETVEQRRFATAVSHGALADDLRKIVTIMGERHGASESAANNLNRCALMIEGVLGPSNTGYTVRRERGPADWPLLTATLKGKDSAAPAVWVATSYDSRPGSPGVEANATGLAATLAAAQALAADQPAVDIHFVFLPHANDPDAPVIEATAKLRELAGSPKALLVVEAMGSGESLWLSSRDAAAAPLTRASGLGSIRGAEVVCQGDDQDLASILFESGLPAVRVATRPLVLKEENDDRLPDTTILAAATGRLIELVRRCAAQP